MDWLDDKYIKLLSPRLLRFKRINQHYNFRCPLCGDSDKSKTKARGWVLDRQKGARFYCHNCHENMWLSQFIKLIDVNLYYDYVKDRFLEDPKPKKEEPLEELFKTERPNFQLKLKRVSQLPHDHPAKRYVESRMIPAEEHFRLYYAPRFKKWVNSLDPTKYPAQRDEEPRLVLPLLDEKGDFYGFQGRSFRKNADDKYVTILLDDSRPKVYGLDRVDWREPVYVVEGPIDSFFLPNCLASCGGRLETNVPGDPVLVYDNEPRSPETVKKIERAIKDGRKVVIWPDHINEKDINDMILNGFTRKDVLDIVEENTFRGLSAELRLAEWKRV